MWNVKQVAEFFTIGCIAIVSLEAIAFFAFAMYLMVHALP